MRTKLSEFSAYPEMRTLDAVLPPVMMTSMRFGSDRQTDRSPLYGGGIVTDIVGCDKAFTDASSISEMVQNAAARFIAYLSR